MKNDHDKFYSVHGTHQVLDLVDKLSKKLSEIQVKAVLLQRKQVQEVQTSEQEDNTDIQSTPKKVTH